MTDNGNGWLEKAPLSSKKFLAFLLAEASWKVILGFMVVKWTSGVLMGTMLAVIIVAGFIEAVFIGGQAAIDAYVRVAQVVAGKNLDPPKDPPPE